MEWPRPDQWDISAPEYTFTFQLPFDTAVELRTMAYNEYDKFTESNTIGVGTIENPERLRQEMQQQKAEELLEKKVLIFPHWYLASHRSDGLVSVLPCFPFQLQNYWESINGF